MTPLMLQDALVAEIKQLFEGFKLKNANNELVPLNIYPQYLPAKKNGKDTAHFPYIVIILQEAEDTTEIDPRTQRVLFMVGIRDDNEDYQGYRDVCNVLEKIYEHIANENTIDDEYQLNYPIITRLHDEDTFPYFFGALDTSWNIGKISMEESLI